MALFRQLVEQLKMNEMDLPQIRLSGIARYAGPVFHRPPTVCVSLDADPSDEADHQLRPLAERVSRTSAYRHYST